MLDIFSNMGPATDLPDVGNTLNDDTVGGSAGTYEAAATNKVETGEQYGEGGTEHTGTLDVTDSSIFFLRRR